MWGGRFATGPDAIMEEINASIDFDQKLWRQDIRGSLAHAAMLAETGILTKDDVATITAGGAAIELVVPTRSEAHRILSAAATTAYAS